MSYSFLRLQMAAHGVVVASAPHAHVLAQNGGQAHLIGNNMIILNTHTHLYIDHT